MEIVRKELMCFCKLIFRRLTTPGIVLKNISRFRVYLWKIVFTFTSDVNKSMLHDAEEVAMCRQ